MFLFLLLLLFIWLEMCKKQSSQTHHYMNSEKLGDSLRSPGWESELWHLHAAVSPCRPPTFLVSKITAELDGGWGTWGWLFWEDFLLTGWSRASRLGLPLLPLAHWFVSFHSCSCLHLGIWASQGQGKSLPNARHPARPLRAAPHCELGPEPRLQKHKTKAGPTGSLATTGEPRIPSRPGKAAVKAWLCGQIPEPILAAPSLGPSTLTWSDSQPERAGHGFLPRKPAAMPKQVLWPCWKEGDFIEDGGKQGEGSGSSDRAF